MQISKETVRQMLADEDLKPLQDALEVLPPRARPDHASSIRWIIRGFDGNRLEAIRIGRRWFTTESRVLSFVAKQTVASK